MKEFKRYRVLLQRFSILLLICFYLANAFADIKAVNGRSLRADLERPIKIGITETPPFIIIPDDHPPKGFMMSLLRMMEKHHDAGFDYIEYNSWSELLQAAKKREVDAIFLAQKTADRLEYFEFTRPIITVQNHYIVHDSYIGKVAPNSLNEAQVVASKDSANYTRLVKKGVSVNGAYSAREALLQVANQESEIAIVDAPKASYYMNKLAIDNIKIAGRSPYSYHLAIATRNDMPKLNLFFENAIVLTPESKRDSLKLKWGLVDEPIFSWHIVYYAIVVIASLSLITLYVLRLNRKLKREIDNRIQFETLLAKANANIQTERNKAQYEARTDSLTGANNRRRFHELLSSELSLFSRENRVFSLIMLDIDLFKSINDEYGHDAGDNVLVAVCRSMMNALRPYDLMGRVGGEEFAVILPGIHLKEAESVAERIRENINSLSFKDMQQKSVTTSLGVTQVKKEDDKNSLLKRTDEALYQSKENGRNRVTVIP